MDVPLVYILTDVLHLLYYTMHPHIVREQFVLIEDLVYLFLEYVYEDIVYLGTVLA